MTKKERFSKLAIGGCVVCKVFYAEFSNASIHHLTGLGFRCMGKKADWENTIALCPNHHQYGTKEHPAIHSHPKEFYERFGTQGDLLKLTNDLL